VRVASRTSRISRVDAQQQLVFRLLLLPSMMTTSPLAEASDVDDFWADLNRDILNCLAMGPISPGEIGRRLGISEGAAASCLSLLASEGRVRICLVEKGPAAA
jgi:hypothetical protein